MSKVTRIHAPAKVRGKSGRVAPVAKATAPDKVVAQAPALARATAPPPPVAVVKPVAAIETVAAVAEPVVEAEIAAATPAIAAAETVVEKITEETSVTEPQTAPIVAPVATKEAITMVEQLKTTAQTAFAQATDKGRETLEKTVKSFGEANEFAKGNVEALVASGKAASAGLETIVQSTVEFSKKSFEDGTAVLKTLAAVRTPTDAFKIQNDFAKSQFDGLVAEMSRSTEVMMKLMGDVFEPLSSRFALASEKVKTAVAR